MCVSASSLRCIKLALQDVKDGFAGLGPLSDEVDRVTLIRLYFVGLSYAMGILPKGPDSVGEPVGGESNQQIFLARACAQSRCTAQP